MALVHADRVKETSVTTGTGTYDLDGAVAAFRTFVAGIATTNKCYYLATMGNDWELGLGTVTDATPDTLARTRVIKSSNSDAAVNWGAGTKTLSCVPFANQIKDAAPPKGYIFGLTMANDAGDVNNDILISAGEATDETGEIRMILTSSLVKRMDAAWVVGTAQGGLNTGGEAANTWYEVILIYREDTGVTDVMFSTTANRDTLPTNYTHKRRIGWIRNDGSSNILPFTQVGDYFTLTTQINDVSATATATATVVALTVPPNSIARFRATTTSSTAVNTTNITVFSEIVEGNVTPNDATGIGSIGACDVAGADGGHFELRVNGSSQIEHDSDGTTYTFDISTFGWIDDRGRDA